MNSDGDLLRRFAETHDEACFAEVVQRHIRFVYAVSYRRLRDAHSAQDATQSVFIALARKARSVADAPSLPGWLHRSACYETRNLMRAQAHRLARESEALRLGTTGPEARPHLPGLDAVLDETLCELSPADRDAILARYFSERSYAEIGATLRLTENAARMRVDRALAKLRDRLERRGFSSTAAALASTLPACANTVVPTSLAAVVTKASVLGAAGGTGLAAALTFMSTAKVITGLALVAALGGGWLEYHRTSQLAVALAAAQTENAAARRRLETIQQQLTELKQQRTAAQAASATSTAATGRPAPAVHPTEPATAVPGVTPKPPKGWAKNGSANDLYEVGVDEANAWGGMPSAYAKSVGAADGKFGGMMQTISADAYRNQRVRLTGWMKTEDANDGGGHLWMRVDAAEYGRMLQFDNMDGRAAKGTSDWQEDSVVLDVPSESVRLAYGFFVEGKGKVWVNGVTITPVGNDLATTDMLKKSPPLPTTPVNLGFTPPSPN